MSRVKLSEPLLTTAQAAELLNVAPATLRWWHHARRGPRRTMVGRSVRYSRRDLEAWLSAGGDAA